MPSSSTSTLPKIGPGLGSRQRIWERVLTKVLHDTQQQQQPQYQHQQQQQQQQEHYTAPRTNSSNVNISSSSSTVYSSSNKYNSTPGYYPSTPLPPPHQHHPLPTPIASSFAPSLSDKERRLLQNLANSHNLPTHSSGNKSSSINSNSAWLEFIPTELIDIYYAIYDEMKVLSISEKEVMKIDKDVPRTFGLFARHARHLRLNFPSDMTSYYAALKSILCAISYERGYCQGINFIVAAMLIQYPEEKQVYTILSYLLKYQHIGILFDPRFSSLLDYMRLFEKKLRKHNRNVYNHFKKCDFTTVSYAIEWFTTCFIVSSPGEFALCVLDLLIAGFDNIMIRVGLSLLDFLEEKILQLDFEGLHSKFKFLMTNADPIIIMANAIKMKLETEVNFLQVMAQRIESMDPALGGNLQFARRTAISGRKYSEILISPMKLDQSSDTDENSAPLGIEEFCFADDERSPPSLHKLLRESALEKNRIKLEQNKFRQFRKVIKVPTSRKELKGKPQFTNQPSLALTPNEKLLPNSPNSPIPMAEGYAYNAPTTPYASSQPQFNMTGDPAMYQATNVGQTWWTGNSWKASFINSFRGVGKLFQPAQKMDPLPSTVREQNFEPAIVISSGVNVPPSTPPRTPKPVLANTPMRKKDDLELESAVVLSDSEFSSDISESKKIHLASKHRHHGNNRFKNRKLITFLYHNLYHSINGQSVINNNQTSDGDGQPNVRILINECEDCGIAEDQSYFGDCEFAYGSANVWRSVSTNNVRVINSNVTDIVDKGGEDGTDSGYLNNSMIELALNNHLHEGWFTSDGKKISRVNLKLRNFHCSRLTLMEVSKKLSKGHVQHDEDMLMW